MGTFWEPLAPTAAEKNVVGGIIDRAFAHGWNISVGKGEGWNVYNSTDKEEILANLGKHGGVDSLYFYDGIVEVGWVLLSYGGAPDGSEVMVAAGDPDSNLNGSINGKVASDEICVIVGYDKALRTDAAVQEGLRKSRRGPTVPTENEVIAILGDNHFA